MFQSSRCDTLHHHLPCEGRTRSSWFYPELMSIMIGCAVTRWVKNTGGQIGQDSEEEDSQEEDQGDKNQMPV